MKRPEQNAAVVLCSTASSSLNLLRCFAEEEAPILLASTQDHDLASRSRYCHRKQTVGNSLSTPERFVFDLLAIAETFRRKAVLFYGDDATLLAVSRHRQQLAQSYHFLMPDPELVEALVDKMRFAGLAERFGLDVPGTLRSSEIQNVDEVFERISLPCILKPNVRFGWSESQAIKDGGNLPRKVLLAQSRNEFGVLYEKMRHFTYDFVVQEYIPGGPDCIYSFHAYCNRRAEPLAYFVGRKIRTYPMDSGESTYLELVKEPEVVRVGLEVLNALKFVGPVKIDFKRDPLRNRLFLLEINARFNLWHYLGAIAGINIPRIAYADLTGRQISLTTAYQSGVRWLSFGNDFRMFRDCHHSGDLTTWGWLSSYCHPKIYSVFSWRDPYPLVIAASDWLKGKFMKRPSP